MFLICAVLCRVPPGEAGRGARQGKAPYRSRRKRSRVQASKDASKLVLLCDEDILEKDPLREHKDIAFAQTYLNRVRDREGWSEV